MAPTHILRRGRSGEALGSAKTRLVIELLESRLLLASYSPLYIPLPDPGQMAPAWRASPSLAWYTPQQIKHAYGIDLIRFTNGTVVGDGTGMTIAIVDAYDHPNIVNDLHAFDQQFGLPDPPLVKVNQVGDSAHLPAPAPPSTPTIAGWGEEAALDVEWAHAIAPKAKILLVEADDDSLTNFNAAVEYASTATGVVVVSMSFGDIEDPLETQDDSLYQTPSGHGGVTFVASAGDDGAPPIYPAISPNVLAVGGTTIDLDAAGNILSEIGWTGSGGGISAVESQPSYQSSLVIHNGPSVISANGMRTNPDVGYSSDGSAGFPIYDSYDSPAGSPWERLGGTSAAAPQWAALIAIADQGRALHGLGSLDGPSETLPKLYALPTSFFHDITTGDSTGTPNYTAGNGYDLVTGLGSPRADAVVAALVGLSVISSSPAVGSTVTVAPVSYTVNFSDFVNTASLQASDFTVDGAAADQVTLNPAGLAATFTFNTNPVTSQGSHVMHIGVGAIVKQGDASTTIQDFTGSFQFAPPVQAATHFTVSAPAATTAGNLFVFSVTAKDQFNNTATGYTGTVHITCGDSQAILSTDVTLAAGVGFFAALLRTAGTQTLTATDSVNTNLTGTSGPITVNAASLQYLGVSAPASAATGVAFGYTVRALDAYNNVIAGYGGTVHFTTTDSAANLPADSTLTNGIGSFSAVLSTAGNQILTATDKTTSSLGGSSNLITVRGLMVTSLTPTATGFVAAFNKPFDPATLNLYDSLATYGAADVTVVGPSGTVRGSLLIDSTNSSFTFIKTGIGVTGVFPGVLASGSYTVTFRSAANGFKGLDGGLLDGNGDGTSGDNYVTTFTPPASAGPVLSVPDFARGPNGAANIKVPQSGGTGIPITLSNPVAVTDVIFQLHYNPALLVITGTLSNTSGTFSLVGTASGGVANLSFHSNTALSANLTLGQIVAHVPDSAAANYKAKELLHLSDILINGATASVVNDDGVHVAAYVGDVSGDGALSPLDASLIARVAGLFDSGFAAYRLVDPAIVADISGNNFIDSSDVTLINRTVTGITVAQLPPIPTGLTISPTGPDPTLSLPTNLTAAPGTSVVVPVQLDTARPEGSMGLMEAILALRYDPKVFTVSAQDVHLGTLPLSGQGWKLQTVVNAQTGEIGIDLFSPTPIVSASGGSLVTLTLHVLADAPAGASGINLVRSVNPTGQRQYVTTASDAAGPYILHPVVTDDGLDAGVDGRVTVPAQAIMSSTTSESLPQPFYVVSPASAQVAASAPSSVLTSGHELTLGLMERIFGDLEAANLLLHDVELGRPAAVLETELSKKSEAQDMALAQALDGAAVEWAPVDYLAYLGQKARRNVKSSLLDPMNAEDAANAEGVAEFFAREATGGTA